MDANIRAIRRALELAEAQERRRASELRRRLMHQGLRGGGWAIGRLRPPPGTRLGELLRATGLAGLVGFAWAYRAGMEQLTPAERAMLLPDLIGGHPLVFSRLWPPESPRYTRF